MSNEFQFVTRKKWIARKSLHPRPKLMPNGRYDPLDPRFNVDKFVSRVWKLFDKMVMSDYFTQAVATMESRIRELHADKRLQRLVCFGIGSFTRNIQALHQLAFVVSVHQFLAIPEAIFYDPVLVSTEKEILEKLQCSVMTENCVAKYPVDELTLFYLPHCSQSLTNNLLWSNWRPENLSNVVLIGNSFESLNNRTVKIGSKYIADVLEYVTESPLEDDYKVPNVFNDLSVHVFPVDKMPDPDSDFWKQHEAPLYKDDDEIFSDDDFVKINIS